MDVPAAVAHAVEAVLGEIDASAPGLVEAAYLTGSVALGDFRPDISDIDVVAVCSRRPTDTELVALEGVHRPSRPNVDVLYLAWEDLLTDPRRLSAPQSLEGTFRRDSGFAANPVEWRTLQTQSIPVRGPALRYDEVWFDPDALRRWNLDNLHDYWSGRLDWWRRLEPDDALVRHEHGLQWLVLGVPRLHHTIATLDITSKTGAGLYALSLVDARWHGVIETSIALRADRAAPVSLSPEELRRDAVDLVDWLIGDAARLLGD